MTWLRHNFGVRTMPRPPESVRCKDCGVEMRVVALRQRAVDHHRKRPDREDNGPKVGPLEIVVFRQRGARSWTRERPNCVAALTFGFAQFLVDVAPG